MIYLVYTIVWSHTMEYIDKKYWSNCLICNKDIKTIKKEIGGTNVYFPEAFNKHIQSHNLNLTDYFENIVKIPRPLCQCGICNQKVDAKCRHAAMYWKDLKCGRNLGILQWGEKAKISRLGQNNPMYGATPWNKGLNKENSQWCRNQSERQKIAIISILKKSKHTKTRPHLIICELLNTLNIEFEEEKSFDGYIFDIHIPKYDIIIEIDGDYWHSNPLFYPNGPETKQQERVFYRDKIKNKYCKDNKKILLRFWENDIINNLKEIKKCIQKKLKQLDR